jgi:probable F420-dependent oxidoreductase
VDVYTVIDDPRMPLGDVAAYAARAERTGFGGLLIPEAVHDGFLAALLALEHTTALTVATSVALAFPRSPTVVAYAAWDLQALSHGRFQLGLGAQVRGNVEGRFGVRWTPPGARMRDYVGALRAVWDCWQHGTPLRYESPNYRLDRMQPFFNPGPIERPRIPILLGAVSAGMTAIAGEVADGVMTHPTNSAPRYLGERVLPEVATGARRAGRDAETLATVANTFVATGPDRAAVARERERIGEYLGFLYSTPQYWRTLALYGWEDVGQRLHALSRAARWGEMRQAITDEMLDTLVPAGTYDAIGETLLEWYGGLVDVMTLRMPDDPGDDAALGRLVARLRAAA